MVLNMNKNKSKLFIWVFCVLLSLLQAKCAPTTNGLSTAMTETVTTSNATTVSKTIIERTAKDMPNPKSCPECCGLKQAGWICDPDNILSNARYGGMVGVIDLLNVELENLVMRSKCPCDKCINTNTTLTIYIVEKLKNNENIQLPNLAKNFADEILQAQNKDVNYKSSCRQHIVFILSILDDAIYTSIGADVSARGLMTYKDVELLFQTVQLMKANSNIYILLSTTIRFVTKFVSKFPQTSETVKNKEEDDTKAAGLSTTAVIVLIVICVLAVILGIGLPLAFCLRRKKICQKKPVMERTLSLKSVSKEMSEK